MNNRAKVYWRYRHGAYFLSLAILCAFLSIMQFSHISSKLKCAVTAISANFYISLFLYLACIGVCYYLIMLPLNFFEGFIIEHKFDLSNQGLSNWLKDDIKKSLISSAIFFFIIEMFYVIARSLPDTWWAACALFWVGFSIVFTKLFPVLIIPVFYKYTVLAKPGLRSRILKLSDFFAIKVMDIFEIDFSKNTKKSNAALVGWGKTRRVILADNLVNQFSEDEVEVVVAHEMAHSKLHHIWKIIVLNALSTTLSFFLLSKILAPIANVSGAAGPFDVSILPFIFLWLVVYGFIMMPLGNFISRKMETNADKMAIEATGLKGPFVTLMEKLGEKNLSDPAPSPLVEFLFYDHPPISKRIALASKK